MSSNEQATAKPVPVPKYVADALRNNGGTKVSELSEEQRDRAVSAPEQKGGLRGKALTNWVLEGVVTTDADKVQAALADAEAEAKREAKKAEKAAARGETPAPKASSKYPADVRLAVKRSNELRGKSHGAGPKQHVHVRDVVERLMGGKPANGAALAAFVGAVAQQAQPEGAPAVETPDLMALPQGTREDLKVLQPLAKQMDEHPDGPDPWTKGRHLAGALAAWHEQLA